MSLFCLVLSALYETKFCYFCVSLNTFCFALTSLYIHVCVCNIWPKSLSESWLWWTLPSIPTKNATRFVPRRQGLKPHSIDSKWEIVVKTSNV
ncbi:hypothetical protein Scep_019745 [Stephania cephalantha]|uniref:Uncharacterized protein n=1 Tax=Stephania cephalantha TaxID=152367 RepID=A0AAP0NQ47_9MAGN